MNWIGTGYITIIIYNTAVGGGSINPTDTFLLSDNTPFMISDGTNLLLST